MGVDAIVRRAVFLDRDGVLNRVSMRDGVPRPPADVAEVEILAGVPEALALLLAHGLLLVGVTNQPDVARGTLERAAVERINQHLLSRLPLQAILTCYHDDADGCSCRKPRPGLLLRAAEEHAIDLRASFMVGDRWSDVVAGQAAGCLTFLVGAPYNERQRCQPDYVVADLADAARRIALSGSVRNGGLREVSGPVPRLESLRVKIFADGANRESMLELARLPYVSGFTTNPTLMRKDGVEDYGAFAREILAALPDRPISFEVFADEFAEMERQAREIASWGPRVYVKIPVTNTRGESSSALVRRLSRSGIKLNVTALLTLEQVREVAAALADGPPSCVSVFAGRIADTGRDPVPLMAAAVELLRPHPREELIWASPRELLNIFQADAIGCHIITVTHDVLRKLSFVGKDLAEFSLETVKMFHDDAKKAGYSL